MIESHGVSPSWDSASQGLELLRGNAMAIQRWLRFCPEDPACCSWPCVAAVVVFAFAFVDLAVTRQALQGRYERAVTKVERLEQQNIRLQQGLNRDQEGQNLPDRAWQYFGKVRRGPA